MGIEIAGVKSNIILVENIDETNLPLPFVKHFGLTSGTSVRGTVGLILVRKSFNYFNFYYSTSGGTCLKVILFKNSTCL